MSIIIRPLLTEKSTAQNEQGKYGFEVALKANKVEIKKAIEKMYGVKVESVNTIRQIGKKKSRSTRTRITTGQTSTIKRAIITVAEGEVIDFYQGI
ncbi:MULTISPECIES: 50S ribosomal protein L23 [unclassified Siphonobacter]|uniref:50S ribosomal protein L23 n=1 Tax=unclassified Siphonobacter TaxID=2635712 RepID=UPI000CB82B2A|nr:MULTISPECIES: 50S ribosomal protein L23 [unclassified Siphonobacter]MDQ1087415.1 large subunit ribosomal protein L23 [Siphonobacter sp. SORGH_AS_1065]MDR6193571.1 large subunit ribosomal protein L23 [Siphonobacter sp. SORGH_AS_0500]PKK36424.1 50S ribosomal protein L23 [Siphonobacter sp. SORGH_AS_0500]